MIDHNGTTIEYRSDGIVHISYSNKLIGLREVKEIYNATWDNSPWHAAPILATGGQFTNFEDDARKFLASEPVMEHCSAIAMVTQTLGDRIAANFYIKFNKPSKPTRFFSSESEAIQWLQSFETISKTPKA